MLKRHSRQVKKNTILGLFFYIQKGLFFHRSTKIFIKSLLY